MRPDNTQPWYHRATLYHIYPLSFSDSNGDGFGDIAGIMNHLDYLNDGTAESLGVEAIWLSPIYASPMADWGYDVTDHTAIDPRFGTMKDFDQLLKAIHRRGMKLLLDYIPNHTSDLHDWFVDARGSRDSKRRDWYIWADPGKDGGSPNNWLSEMGGSAWSYDEKTGQYYLHTFLPQQPDLNWRNPKVRKAMLDVLRFWLARGVDGFRADAVQALFKDASLRDDPPNPEYEEGISNPTEKFLRVYSGGQAGVGAVLESFCEVLDEDDGRFLLSESYLNIPGLQQLYGACRKHPIHAPFNFNLMTLQWSASIFRSFIDEYEVMLGPNDWPNYVLGNHDRHRLVSRVGVKRARLLSLLQLTLRGLPVVYYGEELGLPDIHVGLGQLRDPRGVRIPELGLGRDASRGPMPWTGEAGAGFTAARPWLPVGEDARRLNVEVQERQPESMLNLYRRLIHLRAQCPALMVGDYRSLRFPEYPGVFGFIRETELQRMLVLLNFDDAPVSVEWKCLLGAWVVGTHSVWGEDSDEPEIRAINLEPYEGRVYELRQGGRDGTRF